MGMSDDYKQELFGLVLRALAGRKPRVTRRNVWDAIYAAHNGRPSGFITSDNQWLFRAYRNNVSPNPDHLIDAALEFQKQEVQI
jgi:hypothetical protein